MADQQEQEQEQEEYAVALGLAAFLFGDEGLDVVEQRARNFVGNMRRVRRSTPWPDSAADIVPIDEGHRDRPDGGA